MRGACISSYITLIGTISITDDGDGNITGVYLPNANLPCMDEHESDVIAEAAGQINEYLNGSRRQFDLPMVLDGSGFTLDVLESIQGIPYGETRTYSEIAESIGSPRSFRAVGNVCARNTLPIVIPCHRVLPSAGGIGSYTGGSSLKKRLLDHELAQGFPM